MRPNRDQFSEYLVAQDDVVVAGPFRERVVDPKKTIKDLSRFEREEPVMPHMGEKSYMRINEQPWREAYSREGRRAVAADLGLPSEKRRKGKK